jgi:formyl-CoA transferase
MGRDLSDLTRAQAEEAFEQWLAEQTSMDAMEQGQAAHLPWGAMLRPTDILGATHLADRQFFDEVPLGDGTSARIATVPFRTPGTRVHLTRAPHLGEHTREVLAARGLPAWEIDELARQGVI